ncbi:MAG: DUF505 domain-containing protein [Aquificae bacterium]|nr:DUF505 domain-containing protein [Aquificota bacterium]
MILRKEHINALLTVKAEEESGRACYIKLHAESEPFIELEFQNLLEQRNPLEFVMTYWGKRIVNIYTEMVEKGLIDPISDWDDRFRWIGSEIIAMIDASVRNDDLPGKYIQDELIKRGFAQQIKEEKKGTFIKVNEYAKEIYNIYKNSRPRLTISKDLAHYISNMPPGPAETSMLPEHGRFPILMESMRLLSFSVPQSDVYTLSGLGQEVQQVIQNMAPAFETVINEDYMYSLIKLLDKGISALTTDEIELLEALAFIDKDGNILKAGEHLLHVYHLWNEKAYRPVKTFNLETLDEEILKIIVEIWKKHEQNPEIVPTVEEIVHYLLEKPLKEYKHLKEFYGRQLNQALGYQKKEELKKKFEELFTVEELFKHFWEKGGQWYEKMYDTVEESLFTLEAFDLIVSHEQNGKRVYKLTEYGKEVLLEDIKVHGIRDIHAPAVKAVNITKTEFGAPNYQWYKEAEETHLIGGGYPTKSGKLYGELSYKIKRKPHLTRFELQILHKLPEKGYLVDDIYNDFDETLKEEIEFGLNKLEARGFLDILPNNAIVLTEAGKLIKKATSGVPEGLGNPVNPLIVRILEALAKVGNLYVKEEKVRILPKNWEQAIKLSGLDKETFEKELAVARIANYIGKSSINEAGLLILKAYELINQ